MNLRAISEYKPLGVFEGTGGFIGGFFALRVWVGIYLEGLIHVGAYFRNLRKLGTNTIQIKSEIG